MMLGLIYESIQDLYDIWDDQNQNECPSLPAILMVYFGSEHAAVVWDP